jgi:excisionase family DNA binding protein
VNKKWLSVEDITGELGVNKMTVYRLLADGAIPAYKFRRLYRVRPEDLEAYIRDSRMPAKAGEAAAEGT